MKPIAPDDTSVDSSEGDQLELKRFLPYRLWRIASEISERLARLYRERHQISVTEWRVIAILARHAPATASDVCAIGALDKVAVSRAVAQLRDRQLLLSTPSTKDGRARHLSLSAAGQTIYSDIAPQVLRFEQELISSGDRQSMLDLIGQLEDSLEVGANGQ